MIENLNTLTFMGLGEILDQRLDAFSNSTMQMVCIKESDVRLTRYPTETAYLQPGHGMAVLQVQKTLMSPVRLFYLDKPVRIYPGVWFCVFLLGDSFVRQLIPRAAEKEAAALPDGRRNLFLQPSIHINAIYTVFYQEKEKGFFFAGEQHAPCELVYVDKGRLHSVAGGKDYLLCQGDMMLYAPEQWHMQYADKESLVSFFVVSFDMECTYQEQLTNRRLTAGNMGKQLIAKILAEQAEQKYLCADMILAALKELLLTILRGMNQDTLAQTVESTQTITHETGIIESAQRFIHTHVIAHISVEDVAKGINVSASYLTALFRKHLHISPRRYIQRIKLAQSKELIRDGNHNLTQISAMLGYATLAHFSRLFKEEYGIPPSEYARAMR